MKLRVIDALRFARSRVESEEDFYLCNALNAYHDAEAREEAKFIIRQRLGSGYLSYTLELWVADHHGKDYASLRTERGKEKMRKFRLRWADQLIEELEKE